MLPVAGSHKDRVPIITGAYSEKSFPQIEILRKELDTMALIIRNETKNDYRVVEEITARLSGTCMCRDAMSITSSTSCSDHPDFVKELDFVAELDGKLVGNIMYTTSWLDDELGRELPILTFGPVCVLPGYQRKGIGSALIQHTKEIAIRQGAKAIVIFGDPHNYCKHGFKNGKDLNISDISGDHPSAMLAIELETGALASHSWKYRYSPVYAIDREAADEFDRGFAVKEKAYRYTQEIFSISIRSYLKD